MSFDVGEDDGDAALVAMIAKLRAFGATALADAAREAAPLVQEAARTWAAAGTSPYGEPWAPKVDGTRAMPDAAANLTAEAKGPRVILKTTKGYAINNNLKPGRRRQVIPSRDKPTPRAIVDALREGVRRAFEKAMAK